MYSKNLPFEWDWRAASIIERSIGELKEKTNTIATIKRISGTIPKQDGQKTTRIPIDRIRVDFDINTAPMNVTARFNESHIINFYEQSGVWHEDFSAEIFSFIFGRKNNE
jgi:hypothetical protein